MEHGAWLSSLRGDECCDSVIKVRDSRKEVIMKDRESGRVRSGFAARNSLVCVMAAVVLLIPAASLIGNQAPVLQSKEDRYPRYRLRSGDVLDLNFPFTPEFNQTVSVQPDGYINLRGVGDIRVQDKTTPEVVETVRAVYGKILRDPIITVELKEFEKPYFVVGGEIARPGKYELRGDTTLTEAISIAGGFNEKSKTSEILLFRRVSDAWAEVRKVDLKQMLRDGDLREDLRLRPGDMVLVSKSTMAKIGRFIPVPSLGMYFNPITR
jgi:polysaccharide biosynthesis/export protein